MRKCFSIVFATIFAVFLVSCSSTKNLPEDEVLYTGISEISYNQKALGINKKKAKKEAKAKAKAEKAAAKARKKSGADTTGVITAVANAYENVEKYIHGDGNKKASSTKSAATTPDLTAEQRDSIATAEAVFKEAEAAVKVEVEAALSYAPNNGLLGSSFVRFPLHFGLWAYNAYVNSHTKFGTWMFNTFAATPKYITSANPQLRVQIAQNTLRNNGFFRGRVEYEVQPDPKNERQAKIAYSVYPGELFRLGTIEYRYFDVHADSLLRANLKDTYLHTGDAFNASQLASERTRLSTLFQNQGLYFFKPSYITFRADTVQDPLKVHLQVLPKEDMPAQAKNRYYIGRTHITVLPYNDYEIVDSISHGPYSMRWGGKKKKPPVRPSAIHHYLFYQPGNLYRKRIQDRVQEKLAAMGIFSSVQMSYTPRDTTATCDTLDIDLVAMLDKSWDGEFEAKITNKSNGLLGPGLSFGLTKRNAFRGAETVRFKIFGSYEWQTGVHYSNTTNSGLMNSYELGASLDFVYPRIKFFGLTKKMNQRAEGKTTYKLNIDWMNRAQYFQMLDVSGGITYNYQNRRNIKHEFTPFQLNYMNLLYTTHEFDSLMETNPSLYLSMREQFVPSMSYTLTYMPGRKKQDNALIFTIKEAGNIINGIYTACGASWNEKDKRLLGLPFAQFLKLSAEWRHHFPLTTRSMLACRLFAGAVWSYGNSDMAPYSDLFSIGGANSIRAFAVRTIGPGSYHPANSNWSYVDQVGNLKFEANVEYRFPVVASLYGAVFIDAGNIWLMKEDPTRPGGAIGENFADEIALGTGVGLRYDLDFLVIRFDVGIGIHSPYETEKSSYYNMPRFWDSLGFHLAVGYPF